MSRASRKKRKQRLKTKNLVGAAIFILAFVVLIGLFLLQPNNPPPDQDNCPADQSYAAQIAILLDPSDSLNAVQNRSVMSLLMETIEDMAPTMAEVKVYSVGRAGRGVMSNEFRVCKPEHPDNVGSLTGNPAIAERRFEQEFRAPLNSLLLTQLNKPNDSISPIMEAIQLAVVDAFQPRHAQFPRMLFIVSDMIQNSDNFSFYSDPGGFSWLMQQPYYGTLRVDLEDVYVVIFHLARPGEAGRIQRARSFEELWEDYLRDQGSRPARWDRVEG